MPYGPGVRVDTYLYSGCKVSGFYDSLVAKLITWGSSFDESRRRMSNALDEFLIDGINTTIPLYKTIMNEVHFINGDLSTDYLERFSIIDKMNAEIKNKFDDKTKVPPGLAAFYFIQNMVKKIKKILILRLTDYRHYLQKQIQKRVLDLKKVTGNGVQIINGF